MEPEEMMAFAREFGARSAALTAAVQYHGDSGSRGDVVETASIFEAYLLDGRQLSE